MKEENGFVYRDGEHLSRLLLARLVAGEMQRQEKERLSHHMRDCPACSGAYREADLAARGFAEKFPDWQDLRADRGKRAAAARPGLWERLWNLPLALPFPRAGWAVAWAILLAGSAWYLQIRHPDGDLSPKGAASSAAPPSPSADGPVGIRLFLNGEAVAGDRDTLACRPGDILQVGIVSPHPVHCALLYRDDGGKILTYWRGTRPLGLPGGENLPLSLELDGNWRRETLFCIWSSEPFTAEAAEARAAGEGGPGGLHMRIYHLGNGQP